MAAGLEKLSETNLADTRRKCNETGPDQTECEVHNPSLVVLAARRLHGLWWGGGTEMLSRIGAAMGMTCAADYTPHAEPAAAIRVGSLPFTPRHNRLRRLPCQFLTHVPAYLDRATCW